MLQLSGSCSNLCLCFRTGESAVNQQVQSDFESVSVDSDQVTEQSSRGNFQLVKKSVNSYVFMY